MFLLIPGSIRYRTRRIKNLHSIMFLLILILFKLFNCIVKDLHSIMFLLILVLNPISFASSGYLHSIMFLLIQRLEQAGKKGIDLFTFHYVSINTEMGNVIELQYMSIYIPLCFY